jgi:ParB family chromosome partitioning protein
MNKKVLLENIKEDFEPINFPTDESGTSSLSKTKNINNARLIPIGDIIPDPNQPRTHFDPEKIEELAQSIKTLGILEPLNVRFIEDKNKYLIVTGERRYRAAITAGITEIPCLIKELTDQEALIAQVIENVQRENLSPIEEANSIKRLLDSGLTQMEISKQTGKSQPYISQTQKILTLPKNVLEEARLTKIGKEHLLQLTKAENPEALWQEVKQGKTAKETKKEVEKEKSPRGRPENYRYHYNPKGKTFKVIVEFRKPDAGNEEIREALNEALDNFTHANSTPHN